MSARRATAWSDSAPGCCRRASSRRPLDTIDSEVRKLIDEAVDEAKAAPDPNVSDLLTDVYVSY